MSKIALKPLDPAKAERLDSYTGKNDYAKGVVTSPGNCLMPKPYEKYAEKILNFEIRNDDIFVLTCPKNGTTWLQELVWSLMNYENIKMAETVDLGERVPFLECDTYFDYYFNARDETMLSKFEAMKSPRIFKSHLPHCLLPANLLEKCKVVSSLRNPKDTLVSYYHYRDLLRQDGLKGDFAIYFELFMDDLIMMYPYWDTVLDHWENKDHPNMCLLFYEDMKRDLARNIRKVAEFLQIDINDAMVDDLVGRLSFSKLKDQSKVKPEEEEKAMPRVYGKGEIGDWKNYLTEEMSNRMDKVIAEKYGGTGLNFIYE